ncbi:eukaryotic translation initiation factor 2 alpha subunit, putative [Eimeria brunetti]|uniref:Eukaryotic translation initiation factor 2 alpha subunit, putative n=1 Tax=Eimeria brunetti TaxID=51314 RepID=U6LTP9_9EIME|nr:eukaryotic translation initiation factor 2 alpha subunit, putative [Eimeria brunetti]
MVQPAGGTEGVGRQARANLGDMRFYERKFPNLEELVMVKVQRIAEMGAYVSLLEYNNMEGMILMSELSKRRFRSVTKLVKVGRLEAVMVLRVDAVKGYIDLSKSRVSPEDIVKCEERYSKGKKVHQTVRHVASKHGLRVDELNAKVIWPLYKKYGHALDALKAAALDPDEVFGGLDVAEDVKQSLIQDIQLRLAPQALKLSHMHLFSSHASVVPASIFTNAVFESIFFVFLQAINRISQKIKTYRGGDFKQQGEIMVMGTEEERRLEELLLSDSSESEGSEVSEEDEGMGRVEGDVPQDEIEEEEEEAAAAAS